MNAVANTILADLPLDKGKLVVGFDTEWNVETAENDRVVGRSATAVVQLAYKHSVYVLQVADMLATATLPADLIRLLSHPRVLKAGVKVAADLKTLKHACGSGVSFVGGLDLVPYMKERYISMPKGQALHDLCAVVLGECLAKNVPERIGLAKDGRQTLSQTLRFVTLPPMHMQCSQSTTVFRLFLYLTHWEVSRNWTMVALISHLELLYLCLAKTARLSLGKAPFLSSQPMASLTTYRCTGQILPSNSGMLLCLAQSLPHIKISPYPSLEKFPSQQSYIELG